MANMRLRFAPSPTGALHIGSVRTALYNYLLAKKHGGTFILRIEDTDQTRYVPGAEEYIIEALEWCGLKPDEGPGYGGKFGPYRQSERKEIYLEYALSLINRGHAYYAFDTPEELEARREADKAQGKPAFKYDAGARMEMKNSLSLSKGEVDRRLRSGEPYVIRLKVEPGEIVTVNDLIRGEVNFQSNELDDKVILKGDGMPTYHLANIVDDHLMKITHVVRGEEWLPSTAHHILLYRGLGWDETMPVFAHLPLILKPAPESFLHKENTPVLAKRFLEEFMKNHPDVPASFHDKAAQFIQQALQDKANLPAHLKEKDKDEPEKAALKSFLKETLYGKLSKRDGDRLGFPVFPLSWKGRTPEDSFTGFREFGFDPRATVNFLALVGWNPGVEQEIFTMDELIQAFSIEKIGKAGGRFDIDKARWFNQQYIMATDDATLAKIVRPFIEQHGYRPEQAFLEAFCGLMKERAILLTEFWENGYYFFEDIKQFDTKTVQKRWKPENRALFEKLSDLLDQTNPFQPETIKPQVEKFIEDNGLKFGDVMPILRIALSGAMQGPAVFDMMALMGREKTLSRLKTAFDLFDHAVVSI